MFTANAIAAATASPLANSQLITKIYLPREIFPLSAVIAKTLDLLLSVVVLIVIMIYFQIPAHPTILFVPLIFVFQFLLTMGISLILGTVNVFYRDVENLLGVILMVWMYLTPIFYPPELVPQELIPILNLNPMMGITNSYRNVILHGVSPPFPSFLYAMGFSILVFFVGFVFFRKRSRYFADTI
jgi:ABC-2 type transport system permease protein